jgi:Protein of unknown function (DUF1153)
VKSMKTSLREGGTWGQSRKCAVAESAIGGPDWFEVGASRFANRPANTLSGELLIRMSPKEGLPPPNTKRWVVRRKAAVVAAVRSGEITLEEACRFYQLSLEEFLSWERAFEVHGLAGLRVTRTQQYRSPRAARSRSASLKRPVDPSPLRRT